MLLHRTPVLARWGPLLYSLRFELAVILAIGALLPLTMVSSIQAVWGDDLEFRTDASSFLFQATTLTSFAIAVISATLMVLVLRRIRFYPGASVSRSILPVLAGLYGVGLLAVVILRLEYSNKILIASFVSTLIGRFGLAMVYNRVKRLVFSVVPKGKAPIVHDLPRTTTFALQSPDDEAISGHAIIADFNADLGAEWERFLAEAAIKGHPVYHYKQVWEAETGKVQIEHLSENDFGALLPGLAYQKLKRVVDLSLCLLALPFVVPILCGCAIWIRLDGRGPVFFRQVRMGFRGRTFQVLKFRTMSETFVENDRDHAITHSDDARITKVGRILRRYRLDEVPQIYNILCGEMSWIGPRPEVVALSEWYDQEIPFYRYRHIVRPGITGWAQVNQGHVSSLGDVDHKLQFDFYYIKHLSYWLDIIIALRTVRVILRGFGAK